MQAPPQRRWTSSTSPAPSTTALARLGRSVRRGRLSAVSPAHLQPHVLDGLRQKLYAGDQLDAAQARQLLAEVDLLRDELASSRKDFARKAAGALGKRLQDVAAFNQGGCPMCHEAEARAFLTKLQKIAEGA